jgi:hypothetical protein
MHRFQKKQHVAIFMHCFQLFWTRLCEGAFHVHCLYLSSFMEYVCQFDENVSEFILISAMQSISELNNTSQERLLTISRLISKQSTGCLIRCCSCICTRMEKFEWSMLKHHLEEISVDSGYYSIRSFFRQHSWSILFQWLKLSQKQLNEFPFELFE